MTAMKIDNVHKMSEHQRSAFFIHLWASDDQSSSSSDRIDTGLVLLSGDRSRAFGLRIFGAASLRKLSMTSRMTVTPIQNWWRHDPAEIVGEASAVLDVRRIELFAASGDAVHVEHTVQNVGYARMSCPLPAKLSRCRWNWMA